jgi:hypothetical protein
MSSLEMVEYINANRQEEEAELTHADFLKKVPKVLGEAVAGNFSGYYVASNGKRNPCYHFPKREACLMAMSYSYDLQAKVFDKMTELEQAATPTTDQLPVEVASRTFAALHLVGVTIGLQSNVAAISANQATLRMTGSNLLEMIGHTHLVAEVQDRALTPTKLGEPYGMSAIAFNKLLAANGLQARVSGDWTPTDAAKGLYRYEDTGKKHGDGTPITQLKWYSAVTSHIGLQAFNTMGKAA